MNSFLIEISTDNEYLAKVTVIANNHIDAFRKFLPKYDTEKLKQIESITIDISQVPLIQ